MSAWMFDSAGMNRVCDAINHAAKNGCPTPLTLLSQPSAGRKLFEMNAEALRQRYDDADKSGYNDFDKRWTYKPSKPAIDEIQMCKTLHCFLYQCSEGSVPKTKLYEEIAAIEKWFDARVGYDSALYDKIKRTFKDKATEARYNAATWG